MGATIGQDLLGSFGIGETAAEQSRNSAAKLRADTSARLAAIGIPDVDSQKIILESPELIAKFIPELQTQIEEMNKSEMADLKANPDLKSAQLSALNTLSNSDVDKLNQDSELQNIRHQLMKSQGNVGEALNGGMLAGSGRELQAQMQQAQTAGLAGQNAVNSKQQSLLNSRLQKAQDMSTMAGQQQQQSYNQAAQSAQAQDALNKFNVDTRNTTRQGNVDLVNKANSMNNTMAQDYAGKQVATRNQQEAANKALIQQKFDNEMLKAGAQGTADNSSLNALRGIREGQQASQAGQMSAAAAIASSFSDKNLKKNIKPADDKLKELLDNIDAYDYDYLEKVGEPGKHTSVMAQDLEKSEIGDRMVEDTKMGKMVDYSHSIPTMLAALAMINKRLNKIEGHEE